MWVEYLGMRKVRSASLRGGNLHGVVRGMRLLVSDFPWTSQFIHFRCLPLDAWNVASDQLEWTQLQMYPSSDGRWPQHTVSCLTVVHGHKCHRKTPSLHHTIMHKALNRWCERPTNFYKWHGWWWLNDDDYADDGVVLLITIQAINCRTGERLIMHAQ